MTSMCVYSKIRDKNHYILHYCLFKHIFREKNKTVEYPTHYNMKNKILLKYFKIINIKSINLYEVSIFICNLYLHTHQQYSSVMLVTDI